MHKALLVWVIATVTVGTASAHGACKGKGGFTAQETLVQAEIQARIDESIEADEAKDLAAKTHYFAPDVSLKLLDGTILGRHEIEEGMKRDADWILKVSDRTTMAIDCLELKGKEAMAITNQHFVRTVPDRKDGSPHELVTNMKHRETWIYTDAGWLVKRIEELERGATYLDGKLYEP
jgi:hypothetical protein